MTTIQAENGVLVLLSRYDPGLVAAVKSLPTSERKYDPNRKAWMVDPKHGKWLQNTVELFLHEIVPLPLVGTIQAETRLLEVHYIGQCKDRGGELSAYGMLANGNWDVAFPEQILRDWFEAGNATPDSMPTLYAVLGISRTAGPDDIKGGYRRMVKIWHPDVNRGDPDAAEQFKRIQEAYEVLSSPKIRARYDAGLALEASLKGSHSNTQYMNLAAGGYRSPLRCGWIMATGKNIVGRFTIEKILAWEDIYNPAGQTLVVSWPMGATAPVKVWA